MTGTTSIVTALYFYFVPWLYDLYVALEFSGTISRGYDNQYPGPGSFLHPRVSSGHDVRG